MHLYFGARDPELSSPGAGVQQGGVKAPPGVHLIVHWILARLCSLPFSLSLCSPDSLCFCLSNSLALPLSLCFYLCLSHSFSLSLSLSLLLSLSYSQSSENLCSTKEP